MKLKIIFLIEAFICSHASFAAKKALPTLTEIIGSWTTCEKGPGKGSTGFTVHFSPQSTAKITVTDFSEQSCIKPAFSATVTAPVKILEHRVLLIRNLEKISSSVHYLEPASASSFGRRLRELTNSARKDKKTASEAPKNCFIKANIYDNSECLRWVIAKYVPEFGSKYQSDYKVSQGGSSLQLYGMAWQRLPSMESKEIKE